MLVFSRAGVYVNSAMSGKCNGSIQITSNYVQRPDKPNPGSEAGNLPLDVIDSINSCWRPKSFLADLPGVFHQFFALRGSEISAFAGNLLFLDRAFAILAAGATARRHRIIIRRAHGNDEKEGKKT
jgi:hypothetical protein